MTRRKIYFLRLPVSRCPECGMTACPCCKSRAALLFTVQVPSVSLLNDYQYEYPAYVLCDACGSSPCSGMHVDSAAIAELLREPDLLMDSAH